ncbi:hypothetical protein [Stenotrophomonas rhizophila]|uniref:SpaN/EivJ family type III secretion system needle length determinant n=1 Tax=Stenotrophomonas rhizophila TaxID=216778 RepID=UPI00119FEAED|nr:hypothetical protein [Stenotrophomonas rhizophila]
MSVTIHAPQPPHLATTPVDAVPLSERLHTRLPPLPQPVPPRDDVARPAPEKASDDPAVPEDPEQVEQLQPPVAPRGDAQLALPNIAMPTPERKAGSPVDADAATRPDRRAPSAKAPRSAVVSLVSGKTRTEDTISGGGKVASALAPVATAVTGAAAPTADPTNVTTPAPVSAGEADHGVLPGVADRASASPGRADAGAGSPEAKTEARVPHASPTPVAVEVTPASTPAPLQPRGTAGSAGVGAEGALPTSPPSAMARARPVDAAAADTTSAPPAVAAVASPVEQSAAPEGQTRADARRDEANLGTRQHVHAARQAEALQTAMARRTSAGSEVHVAFNSWGAGHSVTARLEGGRLLHMQPSTARVGNALASSVAPTGTDLLIAVESSDSATDERQRRHRDQDAS